MNSDRLAPASTRTGRSLRDWKDLATRTAAIAALVMVSGGCASILNLVLGMPDDLGDGRTAIYGGVRMDWTDFHRASANPEGNAGLIRLICSLDLLPSLALDTVTLPITVPVVLLRKPAEPTPRP